MGAQKKKGKKKQTKKQTKPKEIKKVSGAMSIGKPIREAKFPTGEIEGLGALTFRYRMMNQFDWSRYVADLSLIELEKNSEEEPGRRLWKLYSDIIIEHLEWWNLDVKDEKEEIHPITKEILAVLPQKVFLFMAQTILGQDPGLGAETVKN